MGTRNRRRSQVPVALAVRGFQARPFASRLGQILGLLLVTASAACSDEEAADTPAQDAPVAEATEPVGDETVDATQVARRFLPDAMRRSTRTESFAHSAHVQIDCVVCHEAPGGHESHGTLQCAECHRSGAMITEHALTRAECLSCHHGSDQVLSCSHCHEPVETRFRERELLLPVWNAPRERTLPFDHAVHLPRECATCHVEQPTLASTADCNSCHEDHHRPDARCTTCHYEAAEGVHPLEAHLSCSGG